MSDHYRYTRERVESLLPAVFDDEYGVLASKAEAEIHSGGDPAVGGEILAMVVDIRRAWGVLTKHEHELLECRYYYQLGLTAIVELAGLEDEQEAADDIDFAVQQMIDYLGG